MKMSAGDEILAPFAGAEIDTARQAARARGVSVMAALEEAASLPPNLFTARLGKTFHYPVASIQDLHRWQPAFDVLPFAEALRMQMVPSRDDEGALRVVFGDPFNADRLAWVEHRIEEPFTLTLAHAGDVAAYLTRQEESLSAMESLLPSASGPAGIEAGLEDLSFQSVTEDASHVVRLVRSTLYDALKTGASDIHLETSANGLSIKYRIDGVLVAIGSVGGLEVAEQVISRVKVMAELDIAERRVPQDGRFKVSARQREIDVRVSIMPSIFGEDAVLRILDKQRLADEVRGLTLDSLGFGTENRVVIRKLANEPYGMLLVTGPTGSGKTTTLYAVISETNHGHDKVITIEDPVEYQLSGVLQIPVNEKKGLTFARGLRSILRHDPDRVMVGEIRDSETAQIAVQAALTGHLVFTTVHANNVFDVLGRFTHMEVDPYSFAAALNGIVAQRLVRLNCPHCSAPLTPTPALLEESGLAHEDVRGFAFQAGHGCGQCRGTGYKGRIGIFEIFVIDDEVRHMIINGATTIQLRNRARELGMRTLREDGVRKVLAGLTTAEEVITTTMTDVD